MTAAPRPLRHPFETHALVLLGVLLLVMLAGIALAWSSRVDPMVTLLAVGPSVALVGAVVWALAVGRWWAAAAAMGLLWSMIVQGLVESAAGLAVGHIDIPVAAAIAAVILWFDRPSLTERGRPVAWIWLVAALLTWGAGFVVARIAVNA